ncbi:MAG: DUF433 domain-containing protein [Bryobacterales bacterium]|nr:DUF433 domain-containing protein [Bryobacterales bacterium]
MPRSLRSATGPKPSTLRLRRLRRNEEFGMAMTETDTGIDRMACELVERVPGKVSGQPIVRGTRIMPDPIVRRFARGETLDDIHEAWPSLSMDQIKALIAFAQAQRGPMVL